MDHGGQIKTWSLYDYGIPALGFTGLYCTNSISGFWLDFAVLVRPLWHAVFLRARLAIMLIGAHDLHGLFVATQDRARFDVH